MAVILSYNFPNVKILIQCVEVLAPEEKLSSFITTIRVIIAQSSLRDRHTFDIDANELKKVFCLNRYE